MPAAQQFSYARLCAALFLYAAVLLTYSQTWAFTYDEGYHLLAAQLIVAGKRPYIDFCFPQSPLNAYWNAGWMRLLGHTWRVPHALAALFTIASVFLISDFVFRRFPVPTWRLAAATTAGLLTGLNSAVFIYGGLGQPYGICLFALVAAFRITVWAVDRRESMPAGAAGLLTGAAAASSLLTVGAAPVLLLWMLYYNRAGNRWTKLVAFGTGAAIPFLPVLRLFWIGPRETWFNLVQYHASFRKLYWPETTRHDLEILTSWIQSGPALITGLLAVFGVWFIARRSDWTPQLKAEFYLCGWLAAGISVVFARAHPTFARYFLLVVPFLAVLAVTGLYGLASRVFQPERSWGPALFLLALLTFGLGRTLYDRREEDTWKIYERLAQKVNELTPPNAYVLADEPVYFAARRTPPPGLEQSYSHKVNLGPAENARLHILTEEALKRQVQEGKFATACSCRDYETEFYQLEKVYQNQATVDTCVIFWGPRSR